MYLLIYRGHLSGLMTFIGLKTIKHDNYAM